MSCQNMSPMRESKKTLSRAHICITNTPVYPLYTSQPLRKKAGQSKLSNAYITYSGQIHKPWSKGQIKTCKLNNRTPQAYITYSRLNLYMIPPYGTVRCNFVEIIDKIIITCNKIRDYDSVIHLIMQDTYHWYPFPVTRCFIVAANSIKKEQFSA